MAKLEIISDKFLAKQIIDDYSAKIQKDYDENRADQPGWPLELFGIECGEGWYGIIAALIRYIEDYNEKNTDVEPIRVQQIKEKFGELRFYTNYYTHDLNELISEAEEVAWNTCETCGSTKNIGHTMGWISVVCPHCLAERIKNNKHDVVYRWSDRGIKNESAVIHEVKKDNVKDFLKLFEK